MPKQTNDRRQAVQRGARMRYPAPSPQAAGASGAVAQRPRPGRDGKVNVTGYFSPEVKRQLRHIAVDEDRTVQDLGEALNYLFAARGKPEIAPLSKSG